MDISKINLTITNVLLEWKTLPESSIVLENNAAQAQFERESAINLYPKVLAVGPDVKTIKPGQYAVSNAAGINLVTIDGTKYGLLKEHQIDMGLDQEPKVVDTVPADLIKTEKTSKKVDSFQIKAQKHDIELKD